MLENFTMPKRFSYAKRPITLTAEVGLIGEKLTRKLEKKIINRATELAGTMPFDWTVMDGHLCFVAFFGFETWELALAARGRLQGSNFGSCLWNQDEENQVLGKYMRQVEAEGHEATFTWEDGTEVDWRNDPDFAEKKPD